MCWYHLNLIWTGWHQRCILNIKAVLVWYLHWKLSTLDATKWMLQIHLFFLWEVAQVRKVCQKQNRASIYCQEFALLIIRTLLELIENLMQCILSMNCLCKNQFWKSWTCRKTNLQCYKFANVAMVLSYLFHCHIIELYFSLPEFIEPLHLQNFHSLALWPWFLRLIAVFVVTFIPKEELLVDWSHWSMVHFLQHLYRFLTRCLL